MVYSCSVLSENCSRMTGYAEALISSVDFRAMRTSSRATFWKRELAI